jgi:hypothetical protein
MANKFHEPINMQKRPFTYRLNYSLSYLISWYRKSTDKDANNPSQEHGQRANEAGYPEARANFQTTGNQSTELSASHGKKEEKNSHHSASVLNQVHELHRLYHVQKQLMQPVTSPDVKPKQEFQIIHHQKPMNPQQPFSFSSAKAPAPAPAEECSLELTLATGPSSSSGSTGRQQAKRLKSSSHSDSGTTAVSSTSTESELALLGEVDVTKATVRFQSEGRRMDEGAWMYQCLSLKMA